MRYFLTFIAIILNGLLFGQNKTPEDFGFRHLQTVYKEDTVDILIKSKKGEEEKPKPLFLFCQGSLPIPLMIKYDSSGKQKIYSVFPFNPDSLIQEYHLIIIGKPNIPLIADEKTLNADMTYSDSTGQFPQKYIDRNLLHYYVERNIAIIKFLRKQPWISKNKLVIAGHSEGSTIAAKIASVYPAVTYLIYSGGNPFGRIMTVIERARVAETDTTALAEDIIRNWEKIVADSNNMSDNEGDSYKATYGFSVPPPIDYLRKLKIPVLVTYGTKDYGLIAFADYFRVETIRQRKNNFTFKAYIGTEHNFFPLKPTGEINYDIFNWDKVALDWQKWLRQN
jgi:Dienelactone hydrolase family